MAAKKRRTAGNIRVMVGQFGSDPVTIIIRSNSTIEQVLAKAGVVVDGQMRLWLNGSAARVNARVRNGDLVSIVSPKEAGF